MKTTDILAQMNHVSNNSYTALGWIKHDEVLELSRLSHATLFPSLQEETFGYAVVESMLSGTIPIASSIGAIPEILHDTYAESTIFHPGSVGQLAERIERVMSLSREELGEIGASLRNAVLKKFDENDIRRKLIGVFQ